MAKPNAPQFEGWEYNEHSMTYRKYRGQSVVGVIGRFDGWNWGWLITESAGRIVAGELTSNLDPWKAAAAADKVLSAF